MDAEPVKQAMSNSPSPPRSAQRPRTIKQDATRPFLRTATWLLAAITALSATLAQAAVIGLNVAPSSQNVAIGQTGTVTVTWTVVNSLLTPSTTSTVTSFGAFLPSCTLSPPFVLGTLANPVLTSTVPTGGATTVTQSVVDTVIVPADLIQRARDAGLSTFFYLRRFFVPPTIEAADPGRFACVALNITGSAGAGFSVSREALSFDNGAPVRIAARGQKLQALAQISYTGIGLLQGVWEVAEPPTTSGEPIYRALSQVRQSLVLGDTQKLESPDLPTGQTGLYLLRFRITDPPPAFTAPVIRYFVAEGRPGAGLPAQPLALGSPPPGAVLTPDTSFTWDSIEGASAYQLEIYATGRATDVVLPELGAGRGPSTEDVARALSRAPVAGVLVPGNRTQTMLSAAMRARLQHGQGYLWRVLAIGKDGSVFGQSPMRQLATP
jgi:hypothetical protein